MDGKPRHIDIHAYRWILDNLFAVRPINIELSGGEPGLVRNLDMVVHTSLSFDCQPTLLSNGLVRQNKYLEGYGNDILYMEHFCENLTPSLRTNAFYNSPVDMFTTEERKLLLVLTDPTMDVLLNNPKDLEFWGSLSLVPKVITPKTFYPDDMLIHKTEDVLRLILKNKHISSITRRETRYQLMRLANLSCMSKEKQETCARQTPSMYIDLDTWVVGQCCINIVESQKDPICVDTLRLAMEGKLFIPTELCSTCYKYH